MATDPVCGMDVLPEEAVGTSRYKGADYYFCAVGCKEAFDKSPGPYLSGSAVEAAPLKLLEITPKQPEMVGSAKQIEIPIRGMSCASCVQRIENALLKTPGVVSADVNFAAERATVLYLPSVAEPGSFRKAIEEARVSSGGSRGGVRLARSRGGGTGGGDQPPSNQIPGRVGPERPGSARELSRLVSMGPGGPIQPLSCSCCSPRRFNSGSAGSSTEGSGRP